MTARWLAWSCPHNPLADTDSIAFLHSQIEEWKPEYLIALGDDFEAAAASRWPHEYDFTLLDEFHAVDDYLTAIERVAKKSNRKAKFVKMMGNHCANVLSIGRINPQLRDAVNWLRHEVTRKHWKWSGGVWDVYPYEYGPKGVYRLGQVSFYHGYEAGVSADEMQSYILGLPYGLSVAGHTHRPVQVTQAQRTKRVPLPYWYANAGTLGPLKPQYVERQLTINWGAAIVRGECKLDLEGDQWFSKNWDAETKVYKMYGTHDKGEALSA